MSTLFSMTARDMVTQALREIGVIASGEEPTADEMSDGIVRLNSMLKSYAAKGLNLWRYTEGTIDFAAGESSKAIADAASIQNVRLAVDVATTRMLVQWEVDDFAALPNRDVRATPTSYSVVRAVSGLTLNLWPVPDRALTIRYAYGRITNDVIQPADPIDVPQMFQEAVWTMLAVRLAPTFGKARADPATVQLVAARAAELERDMLDYDRPDSYMLGTTLDGYP